MKMKNFLLTNLIAGTFAVGTFYVPNFFDRVKANDAQSTNTSSSIKVQSNSSGQGNSSVHVKQTVRSNNNEVEVYTYREENGKVLEDNRRTIRSENSQDFEYLPNAEQIRQQTKDKVQNEAEAALKNFEEQLKQAETEIASELEVAEDEIAAGREEIEQELDQISEEVGGVEAELRQQWQRQLEEREENFWQRIRSWILSKIEGLR